jgi:tripartite ATP-independent transporter DctP family solute receptor
MKRMLRIAGIISLIVFISVTTVDIGQAAGKVNMKLAWAETAEPYSHPTTAALTVFKSYVESNSGGTIDVHLYPAGQLGDAKSMIEQVKRGVIQSCASVPSGMIAGSYYSVFNIFDIPYLFSSNAVAWRVLEPKSKFFQDLSDSIAKHAGLRTLGFFIEGRRHFTNNVREVRRPQDLKGLKIRTMEVPAHQEMMRAMGAIPTPVSWLELYSALQTGVVNGQENPIGNIAYLKAYEVQKYLTLDGHLTLVNTWVVNERWFQKLSSEQRQIIREAAEVATLVNRGYAELKDTTGLKELKEKGMRIYSPTLKELAAFKAATQPRVIKYIKKSVKDPQWIKRILNEVKKAETALNRLGQIK